jgi:hypothetical protein
MSKSKSGTEVSPPTGSSNAGATKSVPEHLGGHLEDTLVHLVDSSQPISTPTKPSSGETSTPWGNEMR